MKPSTDTTLCMTTALMTSPDWSEGSGLDDASGLARHVRYNAAQSGTHRSCTRNWSQRPRDARRVNGHVQGALLDRHREPGTDTGGRPAAAPRHEPSAVVPVRDQDASQVTGRVGDRYRHLAHHYVRARMSAGGPELGRDRRQR